MQTLCKLQQGLPGQAPLGEQGERLSPAPQLCQHNFKAHSRLKSTGLDKNYFKNNKIYSPWQGEPLLGGGCLATLQSARKKH